MQDRYAGDVGKCELVKHAMLAVQRYPWEQGVCAQAVWETETAEVDLQI